VQGGLLPGEQAGVTYQAQRIAQQGLQQVGSLDTFKDHAAPAIDLQKLKWFGRRRAELPGSQGVASFLVGQVLREIRAGELEHAALAPGIYLGGATGGDGAVKRMERIRIGRHGLIKAHFAL
jgi:hypothetical protein